jgi:hypothetical protein
MPNEIEGTLNKFGFFHRDGMWWRCGHELIMIGYGTYTYFPNNQSIGIEFDNIHKLESYLEKR